jgi:hypothetical protein
VCGLTNEIIQSHVVYKTHDRIAPALQVSYLRHQTLMVTSKCSTHEMGSPNADGKRASLRDCKIAGPPLRPGASVLIGTD